MKVMFHPPSGQVDLASTRAGLRKLAALLASGSGTMAGEQATSPWGEIPLARIAVGTSRSRVLVSVDAAARTLSVTGAPEHLNVLAEIVDDLAAATAGGHVHVEHYPDHPYLQEGSFSLILNSPLGGMP